MTYSEFIRAKACIAEPTGLDCNPGEVHPALLPHQRDIVAWAVRGGQRAIFTAFGLGKTLIQLETLRLTLQKSSTNRALVILPLNVRQEFIKDAKLIGLTPKFIRIAADLQRLNPAQAAQRDLDMENPE